MHIYIYIHVSIYIELYMSMYICIGIVYVCTFLYRDTVEINVLRCFGACFNCRSTELQKIQELKNHQFLQMNHHKQW